MGKTKTAVRRIAILAPHFPPSGGGGVMTAHFNLYRKLVGEGFDVKVFTFLDTGFPSNLDETHVVRNGAPRFFRTAIKVLTYFFFRLQERCECAYQVSDILQSSWGMIRANFELIRYRPDVVILPDHGCPGFYLRLAKHVKVFWISHHNPMRFLDNPLLRVHSKRDARLAVRMENLALKRVSQVICPSNYMVESFRGTYRYDGPVRMIPNLLEHKFIREVAPSNLRKSMGLGLADPLIYIPSAGSILKGSHFVTEIIRRLGLNYPKKIGFYLSGSITDSLRHQLTFLPKHIVLHMPGHLDYAANIANMKECDFGITPTLIESFGMAVIEALECGIPMVSFDVGGVNEVLVHGENGILVPAMNIERLIDASMDLLVNQELRARMQERALETTSKHFCDERILGQWLDVIEPGRASKAGADADEASENMILSVDRMTVQKNSMDPQNASAL